MVKTPAVVSTAAVLLLIWMGLNLSLDPQEITIGLAAAVIIGVATGGALTGNLFKLLKPAKFASAVEYVFYFIWQMIKANIDIFFRVFKPVIPIRPGIVKAELHLKSPRARSIVANSITLTPGTITIDTRGDFIFVHWVFLPDGDVHEKTQQMVDSFAGRLEKIFE